MLVFERYDCTLHERAGLKADQVQLH